jgi:hypothetical protein
MLNMVEENLKYNSNWNILNRDPAGKIQCVQDIQIQGLSENMRNELSFFDFQGRNFLVEMENQNVGHIIGKGVFDDKLIAWEFRENDLKFEGYETYLLQDDGSYLIKGEYVSSDQFRTQIEGRIWLPTSSQPRLPLDPPQQDK